MPPVVLTLLKLQANERFHDLAFDRDNLPLLLLAANARVDLLIELDALIEETIMKILDGDRHADERGSDPERCGHLGARGSGAEPGDGGFEGPDC